MADASPAQDRPLRELRGVVERITYQNAQNGFTVARLAPSGPRGRGPGVRGEDRLVAVTWALADSTPRVVIVPMAASGQAGHSPSPDRCAP